MKKFVVQYMAYGIDTGSTVTVYIDERESFILMSAIKYVYAVYQMRMLAEVINVITGDIVG